MNFGFRVRHKDKKTHARVGQISTPHGKIQTPSFVPVGTQATVKSLTPQELNTLGVQLFFVNTYHAYLRPGVEILTKAGGLHKFMGWSKPLITDSGGFQVFSLGKKRLVNIAISESAVLDRVRFTEKLTKSALAKLSVFPDDYRPIGELVSVDDEGVTFTSHWDGTKHRFSPEISMEIQRVMGSDIHIAFDECAPYPTTYEYAKKAMARTHAWAKRSLKAHSQGALYGVVQGSIYEDLRKESAKFISSMDFDGIAIGGVSVGESKKEMKNVLDWVSPFLPENKPRHLLGVGEIDDIFTLVEHGVDTFDCVQPTRLARVGMLYEKYSQININKAKFAGDFGPVERNCTCYTCTHFTRAYIHHLFRVRELLGYRLATIHNLHYIHRLTENIREAIRDNRFLELKDKWL